MSQNSPLNNYVPISERRKSPYGIGTNWDYAQAEVDNAAILLDLNEEEWDALYWRIVTAFPTKATPRDISDWECVKDLTRETFQWNGGS